MAMERWNPFREMLAFREAMDRMFDESFLRAALPTGRGASFPIDLAETDQGFMLRASLPGVKPEDVQITIHGDTLNIRGESKTEEERKEQNWIIHEQRSGAFHRTVTLPAPVNPDQAEARFHDGILELTLPKAEQARPRQIKVASNSQGTGQLASGTSTTSGSSRTSQPPRPSGNPTTSGSAGPTPTQPTGTPARPSDKDRVQETSEESMGTSDPPGWTHERT